jgi:hypothetical protein
MRPVASEAARTAQKSAPDGAGALEVNGNFREVPG